MAIGGNVTERQLLRIAVIEDDKDQGETIAQGLNVKGFSDVQVVGNAEEIVRTFREYDVLLLDLDLGGADGIDVAEQVLSEQPGKWIFVLSGNPHFLDRLRRQDLPLSAVFEKPLRPGKMDDLVTRADEMARKRRRTLMDVDEAVRSLQLAGEWAGRDILTAQRGLAASKEVFRERILPVSRERAESVGVSPRRSIVLLTWGALQRLSFVPSDELGLVVPTSAQLATLAQCVSVLQSRGLTTEFEDQVDDWLFEAGLWPGQGRALNWDEPILAMDPEIDLGPDSTTGAAGAGAEGDA